MKILNRKESKEILEKIEQQWQCKPDWLDKYFFVLTDRNKLHLINREYEKLQEPLKINTLGLYVAEIDDKKTRLSIEGSQMVAKTAVKNILEINEEQAKQWIRGEDINIPGNQGFVILKQDKDILGCGQLKEGKLHNYTPKARRLTIT